MKRIGLNIASALLAFAFGVGLSTLSDALKRSDEAVDALASTALSAASCAPAQGFKFVGKWNSPALDRHIIDAE